MFERILGSGPRHPDLDLDSVRETLIYMRDDLVGVPGLERAAAALDVAIGELGGLAPVETPALTHSPGADRPKFRKLLSR
ncbi:MAG: hypothetical protein F9K44_09340 [Hyphomicrobiaceae bacterium]|nr:MAG: hypothetical protein F9K44_09340 [Hyphomicrobiaceae bacterium]